MKAIILAAGTGSRLEHLTTDKPKCLVELWHEPLLKRQLRQLNSLGIKDTLVITGFKSEAILEYTNNIVINTEYDSSNMVFSLAKSIDWIKKHADEEFIILYADIAYHTDTLKELIKHKSSFPLTVLGNLKWQELWEMRMENPYDDAESFIYNDQLTLTNIGNKLTSQSQAMAQFMGMFKVEATVLIEQLQLFINESHNFSVKNMYMTSLLQKLANQYFVDVLLIDGRWIELDTLADYTLYNTQNRLFFGLD